MRKSIFLAILLIGGCTSIPTEQVEQRISAWRGVHIEQLIKYWGLPSRKQELEGKHFAEWLNQEKEPGNTSLSLGTGTHTSHTGIGIGINLLDLGGSDDKCSRLVEYDDTGRVVKIQWSGTSDFCYKLTPDRQKVMQYPVMTDKPKTE